MHNAQDIVGKQFSLVLFASEDDAVVVTGIDTAWGEVSTQLVDWIDMAFQQPISHAVVTHGHYDRTAGSEVLKQRGVWVRGHPLAHRYAAGLGIPYPDTLAGITEPGSAVRVGAVEIFYPGPGHAAENVMVWVPQAGVLFGGCAVRAPASTTLGNTADADLAAWPAAIRRTLERYPAAEVVVPGHGEPGGPDLQRHTLSLFIP